MSFDETSLYKIKTELPGVRRSLFDLAIWKNGLAFRKINFSENGVPIIKIAELNNGIGSNTSFTKGNYDNSVRLCHDDLLFSWSGNPQTSIDIYRYQLNDGWLNQHIFKVTANEELVSKDFLFYLLKYLKSHFIQIASNKQTTGLGHVTIADLKRMSVVIPNKDIQNKVVAFIKPIDDQIQVNNEINKNLSKLAQMLYLQLSDSISGKDEQPLSDIIDIRDGTHDSPKSQTSGHPLITSKHLLPFGVDTLSANFISQSDYDKINERSKVNTYDILFSMIGTVGLVSLVIEGNVDFAIKNVGLFKTSEHPDLVPYIFEYLKSYKTSIKIDSCLAGSTQKYISLGELRKLPIVIPTSEQLKNYNSMAKPIIRQIASLTAENKALAKLRDSLLPKLMSGEIDVSNISL